MRALASAVCACAIALSMGSCSGEEPPPDEPTTATTPANPDATLPPMPEVAGEFSPKGAANFVAYYVSVLDYASRTGDVQPLRNYSDPECGGCNDYIDFYETTYAEGGWFKDRSWTKSETELTFADETGQESRATTAVTISPGTYRLSASDPVHDAAETTEDVTFGIRFDGAWSITQLVSGDPQ